MELISSAIPSNSSESRIICPNVITGVLEYVKFRKLRPKEPAFLDLPTEVRNSIYHYALVRRARWTPRNPCKNLPPDGGFALLRVHSAIHAEAKSYFTARARAYLPVKSGAPLYNTEDGWLSPVSALNVTYTEALRTIPDIHLHLRPNGLELDSTSFTNLIASIQLFSGYSRDYHSRRKRHVLVHLAWYYKLTSSAMSQLISAIAENTSDDFTVCYCILSHWRFIVNREVRMVRRWKRAIADFENINLRVEVRGRRPERCTGGEFDGVTTNRINFSHLEWRIVHPLRNITTLLPRWVLQDNLIRPVYDESEDD
ncbi:hypothetical protein K491DRAFT_783087 [Lophiostoma macrostomum CBS 122681]|uniref:F-box domain-containing protein n=1 Tax=Lophiostoma macrostomum CBS 122681 TaxID=1314788 RepID=A0A6A6SQ37_9PLEO|nr:hypothetical protein K491DRAFT_783087 [Lophiostoma macrostomum CBS 122681]